MYGKVPSLVFNGMSKSPSVYRPSWCADWSFQGHQHLQITALGFKNVTKTALTRTLQVDKRMRWPYLHNKAIFMRSDDYRGKREREEAIFSPHLSTSVVQVDTGRHNDIFFLALVSDRWEDNPTRPDREINKGQMKFMTVFQNKAFVNKIIVALIQ